MKIKEQNLRKLHTIAPGGVTENVDLSAISRWRIGGVADCVIQPSNTNETAEVISYLTENKLPFVVIGSTSNLLFSDEGLRAVCIQIGNRMKAYRIQGHTVWSQAGAWVPGFARNVAKAGLSGIEHTAGIPGTLGGLVCMNGGSQRKGIGSNVIKVKAVSPDGEIKIFINEECGFKYRTSVFQENQYIITEVELSFDKIKSYEAIRNEMLEILETRRKKFPQKFHNCGSTFISNPNIYKNFGPPGALIEELGFKGYRIGDAQVSEVHANFINNIGKAKARDVLKIIRKLQESVLIKTGFDMEAEVKYVASTGEIMKASSINKNNNK